MCPGGGGGCGWGGMEWEGVREGVTCGGHHELLRLSLHKITLEKQSYSKTGPPTQHGKNQVACPHPGKPFESIYTRMVTSDW